MAEIAGSVFTPSSSVAVYTAKTQLERVLTSLGFSLGLRRLVAREFVRMDKEIDYSDGTRYDVLFLTDKAWAWVETHEDLFVIRRPSKNST